MKTRLFTSLAIATAAMVSATAANASITLVSDTPGTSPYTGPAPTYDFDASTPTTIGGQVVTGTVSGSYAQPYGSTGNYFAAGPFSSSPGTIDLTAWSGTITSLSFIWGSVDWYNTLDFVSTDGTTVLQSFTGNDIFNPANGDQTDPNTNPVVTFLLTGSDVTNFGYLRLNSPNINAFEIDNLAINPPVPEPATWAMMLLGFGGIGVAMRRRRSSTKLAQVA